MLWQLDTYTSFFAPSGSFFATFTSFRLISFPLPAVPSRISCRSSAGMLISNELRES